MKKCITCGEVKPLIGFHVDNTKKDKHRADCKDCNNARIKVSRDVNKEAYYAALSRYRKKNPDKSRLWKRKSIVKSKYGISIDEYRAILAEQGGRCAICEVETAGGKNPDADSWPVDHDHACCPTDRSCGRCIRGLLCHRCNTVLGLVSDDIGILTGMVSYLSHSRLEAVR